MNVPKVVRRQTTAEKRPKKEAFMMGVDLVVCSWSR